MQEKKYWPLSIWALILLISTLAAQKIPESWKGSQQEQLPSVTLTAIKPLETAPKAEQSYRQIVHLSQNQHDPAQLLKSCERFLRQYPDHFLRYNLWQLIKRIRQKNIMLFALGSQIVMPEQPGGIFMVSRGVSAVEFKLWQVDLAATMQAGLDIHLARTSAHARLLKTWREKIADTGFRCSRRLKLAPLKPGYYIVTAQAGDIRSDLVLLASRLALVVKQDFDKIMVWGQYTDGKPLARPLKLYVLCQQQIVKQTSSNRQGLWAAKIRGHKQPLTLVAIDSSGNPAIVDCQWYRSQQQQYRAFIYLDRQFYHPGQTLHGKVFLRYFDRQQRRYLLPPAGAKLHIALQNTDNWKRLALASLAIDARGTVAFAFPLPPATPAGRYCLRLFGWCLEQKYFEVRSRNQQVKSPPGRPNKKIAVAPVASDPVRLHTRKQQYRPSEAAIIQVQKRQPGTVLLTLEAERLLGYRLSNADCQWHFDVDRYFSPCTDVVATMANPTGIVTTRQSLAVPPLQKMLRVNINSMRTVYSCGEKVTMAINVNDSNGNPAVAELLLAVSPRCPSGDDDDIFTFFYGHRFDQVLSYDSFQADFASDREYSVLRSYPALSPASAKPVEEPTTFTAAILSDYGYWQPLLPGNATGKWQLNFVMFPTAGEWEITVLAIDKDTRVGQASLTLRSLRKQ